MRLSRRDGNLLVIQRSRHEFLVQLSTPGRGLEFARWVEAAALKRALGSSALVTRVGRCGELEKLRVERRASRVLLVAPGIDFKLTPANVRAIREL